MAFTRAPATLLALYGGPGQAVAPVTEAQTVTDTVSVSVADVSSLLQAVALSVSDTLSVSISDSSSLLTAEASAYATELGMYGGPRAYHQYAAATVVTTFNLDVSDTLSVQIAEDPVDSNEIITGDSLRIALTDTSALFNHIGVSDALSFALSETVALTIAGITVKDVTDSLSVSLTESSTLNVFVGVTDTLSVSITDTSSVATPSLAVAVSDTLSVSVDEVALLQVFSGSADITVGDVLAIGLTEATNVVRVTPSDPAGDVASIRFELSGPSMRFEFL